MTNELKPCPFCGGMELNREQIVKALECCIEGTSEACFNCVFGLTPSYPVCKTMVQKHALALIRELTDENERLSKEVDRLSQVVLYRDSITAMEVEETKADTVRKMQERLKAEAIAIQDHTGEFDLVVLESDIDQIARELLEEN